jgi:hypothetical protein
MAGSTRNPWEENYSTEGNSEGGGNPWEQTYQEPEKPKDPGILRKAGDLGLSVAKGIVAVPEAAVGLADIPTGGRVGKFLENKGGAFGFRPKQAKEYLASMQSDDLQGKQQQFQQADGIIDKAGVALSNPSLIANAVAESVPLMGAGAVPARAIMAVAPKVGAVAAGAIGEGAVGAGSAAEAIRQETDDGLLTPAQSGLAAATGAATSAFGFAGGKLAQRMGIGDVDTMMTQGAIKTAGAPSAKSIPRQVVEGAIAEGWLEELPQSVSEQVLQNLALNKPWHEGVDDAAVMGTLSGMAMGGAAAGASGFSARGTQPADQQPPTQPPAPAPDAGPTLALPAPDRGVIQVGPDGTARTPAYQAPGYVGDVTDVEPRPIDRVREQVAAAAEQGGALSGAALTAIDSGASSAMQPAAPDAEQPEPISLEEADANDRAAYEQFFASVESDSTVGRYFENDYDIPDFGAASNVSDEDFLRSLGATDEDIQDAIATASQPAIPQSRPAIDAGPQAYEPAGTRQGAGTDQAGQEAQVNAAIQPLAAATPVPTLGGSVGADGAAGTAPAVSDGLSAGGPRNGGAAAAGIGASESGAARPGGRGDGNQALTPLQQARAEIQARKQQEAANAKASQTQAPAAAPVPGAATSAPMEADGRAPDIKAIAAKQIPDMTDVELQQAITHYGPEHKRTAKLQKEAQRRALQPESTPGVNLVPQANQTKQATTQPAQTGAAPAASSDSAAQGAAAGAAPVGSGEPTTELTNAAANQDAGAQAAPAPGTQGAASTQKAAGREGYDTPVELDAARLKAIIEQTRGAPLVDKPAKLEAWRNGTAKTDPAKFPIELSFTPDGRLDVNDGRHRIALAAERGEKVTAFIDSKDAQRAQALVLQSDKAQYQDQQAQAAIKSGAPAESAEQRAQRVAQAGEAWTRMPAAQREALAGIAAGLNPIQRKRVPSAAWADLNRTIQRNLADAMGTRSEFGGNQAGTSVNTAPVATNTVAQEGNAEPRKGEIGGRYAAGEVLITSSGRKTAPFPRVDASTNGKANNTILRVNRWLIGEALAEAQSRGDDFNERQFQAVNNLNPSQSDKDSAEEYLFGEQPAVVPSILKPLVGANESASTPTPSPGVVNNVPPAIAEALDADMQAREARVTRLRDAAAADGQTPEQKKSAQTQLEGAEFVLQKMRSTRFDAEDAALKTIAQKDMAAFAVHIAFPRTNKALQELVDSAQAPALDAAPAKRPDALAEREKSAKANIIAVAGGTRGGDTIKLAADEAAPLASRNGQGLTDVDRAPDPVDVNAHPAVGALNNAIERKARAFAKLKMVREQVKNGTANNLQLLKAASAHREEVREVDAARALVAEVNARRGVSSKRARKAVPKAAAAAREDAQTFSRTDADLSTEEAVAMLNPERTAGTGGSTTARSLSDERLTATQLLVDGLKANWTRAPEIIVARNMQDRQIPQEVRDYDKTLKSQGATGEARGFIYKGKVYLLSDQLKGPQQIAEVLFHEVLGHYGLRGAFGNSLDSILQQIGTMRRKDVVAKAREYGLFDNDALGGLNQNSSSDAQIWDAMSAKDRLSAAEEVLAEMAQSTPEMGFVKRAIAAVRNWLRANMPGFAGFEMTDADIVQAYILPARGFVTRSKETGAQSLERAMLAFSRVPAGSQTETPEFKLWFGNSKVVDADGKPLVVYHGSERSFAEFDIEEGQRGVGGIWFTDSKNYAYDMSRGGWDSRKRGAGGQIVHAYLDVRNPFEFDVFAEGIKLADDVGVDRPVDSLQAQELLSGGDGWDSFVGNLVEDAKRAGHDALVIKNFNDARMVDSTAYVVFDQKAIAIERIETNDQSAPDTGGAKLSAAEKQDQTQTEAFKRWFKDSKVVDADGKPLVVYHGTGADISVFDAGKIGSTWGADTEGFFFTSDAREASGYAESNGPTMQRHEGGNVMPVYLSIQRPVTIQALEEFTGETDLSERFDDPINLFDEMRDDIQVMLLGNVQDGWYIDKDSKPSKTNSHDGVLFEVGGKILAVAVDPTQIKSATGNNGQFDPSNADIRFSRSTLGNTMLSRTQSQTDTPEFKRWFGDSKVVDDQGRPLVVYHGTRGDISVFDYGRVKSRFQSSEGLYFTARPLHASVYADGVDNAANDFDPTSSFAKPVADGANVMPVYVSLQNPKIISVSEWGTLESAVDGNGGARVRAAKAAGHDGVIVERNAGDAYDGKLVIAFRPEQIKSAIGNNGNFDPANPDIRFSRAAVDGMGSKVGEAIKSVTVANIKQRAGFKATDYLGLGLQALGRRQIVDIYGDMLPLGEYNKLVQQMEADKNEGGAEADQLVTRWAKLPDEGRLADLMHDATLAQIDPAKPYAKGDDKAQYQMLLGRFNALSDEAKQVYADTRNAYQAHHAKVRSAIKERIERSELKGERKKALLEQMDGEFFKAVKGVYFPLARFGQYAVTIKGLDGRVESVSRAETKAEAEALRSNLLEAFPRDKGFAVGRVMLSKDFIADRDAVGRGFMTELYQVLDKQDMDAAQRAELEDTLGQLYLSSLPDLSWAKHGIHRKGTPGFSQDARRAFAQNMFHGARYLAKLRYSDLMQDELSAMQKHVDDWREVEDFDQNKAQRVVDEMNKRHESLMNPQSNALSTALTSFGFVFHLGLSPASALVNLSQTALVAYPIMGAKWGYGKASAALLKASTEAAKGKNDIATSLNADERAAYDEAVRAGTIDVTMAHDLAGIAQGEDAGVMWKVRPVMRWASFLFHHAEKFNRQVTFIASYRLARDAGADQKSAFEQATKATYDGHFDYSSSNRPRIMQGNVARVLLLFKQYGQNMVYTLSRSAYQSIKGTDAEKAEARKVLAGLLTTHAMAAGVLGLPMVTTLLAAASMIGGDDDEPWDAKVALQNMLADTFGQKTAEVLAHGLSRLTPWDISGRVGLDRLIFPDVQEGLEGQRLAESAMTAALGPVAGIGVNLLRGAQMMGDGHYALGLEAMLPSALRGPVKAIRYANEGVQDKSGISIIDQVSPAAVAGQALGFSPSEARNAQEGKSAVMAQDRALGERRQELLTKAARAVMDKDAEALAEARKEIAGFNEKNPGRRITPPNITQSVRSRQKRIDQSQDGVYLPKNRRDAMEAGRFALGG